MANSLFCDLSDTTNEGLSLKRPSQRDQARSGEVVELDDSAATHQDGDRGLRVLGALVASPRVKTDISQGENCENNQGENCEEWQGVPSLLEGSLVVVVSPCRPSGKAGVG